MHVRCERGIIWLTHSADPRDIILRAGESFTCVRDGKLVATALEPARLRISQAKAPSQSSREEIRLDGTCVVQ
jgi:hypothetical protein